MSSRLRTRLSAIGVLAVSLLVVVGVGIVRAGSGPSLPPLGADRLLASTAHALTQPVTISGDVETSFELGLPQIPSSLGGEGGPIAMLGGAQRFRVWHSPEIGRAHV